MLSQIPLVYFGHIYSQYSDTSLPKQGSLIYEKTFFRFYCFFGKYDSIVNYEMSSFKVAERIELKLEILQKFVYC